MVYQSNDLIIDMADEMKFKCLMYNVFLHWPGYGNIIRANRIRSFLYQADWDIVGLAEVYSERQRQNLLNDVKLSKIYPYQLSKSQNNPNQINFNNQSTGLVLLSKYKIVKYDLYIYQETEKKTFPLNLLSQKGVIYAELTKDEKNLGVFLTHLFWGRTKSQKKVRRSQLTELRQFINEKKRDDKDDIIMGDLNLMDEEYSNLMTIFEGFKDAWVEGQKGDSPGYTWNLQNTFVYFLLGNYRYDYFLTSPNIEVETVNILHPKNTLVIVPRIPLSDKTSYSTIYYQVMRYLRYIFVPFGLVLHLWRIILRLPSGLLNPMDLSDHYPLEGEFVIE